MRIQQERILNKKKKVSFMQSASPVTILTSGNSLGAYVPGIRLQERLRRRGIPAEAEVLERLFPEETRRKLVRTKQAFHNSFGAALMGTRLARDIRHAFDTESVDALLERWQAEGRRTFLAMTGFWLPVLDQYVRRMRPDPVRAEFLRLDAIDTPSYRAYRDAYQCYRHHWLFRLEGEHPVLQYRLAMSDEPIVPYAERDERIVVHGGGWGIGTYRSAITALQERFALDLVAYEPEEAGGARPCDRIYMTDPDWHPWSDEPELRDEAAYPPTAEWKPNEPPVYERGTDGPRLYGAIRRSLAIVSKPGGGTLVDSLSAATPLVYLEPFGDHERANALLWERLGFGIAYDRWARSGFAIGILTQLHDNLKRHALSLSDYGGMYP
ncbi:hypothetical protein [Paenibacillus apiarius]|uniref:UDP-glucuronosyltransferase n=2 Tax=Paenibacillus apiarius TaxID=46240 RepID=A0ABT4E1H5_9BACL|nr:hypothetical protein [Paenibacillus apiarius]MCY9517558.1 hypothetical protein [Paenibacillus apiarius]MCY9522163.1 hypothetical protein [Paenibacillus apiarius]MCY9560076.1 hypothetical protein [Paenibacillus apiarius]MCY9683694.1 hypothetical protein [Paenibacillus apiarius]MCY9723494.1 hypothetical protein [Paenibacillus apiarius]